MSRIDEIFDRPEMVKNWTEPCVLCGFNSPKAKQQLLELLDSCKPEELEDVYCNKAYNKALNEYHSNIRKLFE